jgi:ferredoxin
MPRITFRNDGVSVEVAAGSSLQMAAHRAEAGLPFGCRAGTCGTCALMVVRGEESLDEPGFVERDTLAVCGHHAPGMRLGCQLIVGEDDLEVAW